MSLQSNSILPIDLLLMSNVVLTITRSRLTYTSAQKPDSCCECERWTLNSDRALTSPQSFGSPQPRTVWPHWCGRIADLSSRLLSGVTCAKENKSPALSIPSTGYRCSKAPGKTQEASKKFKTDERRAYSPFFD
ncbi:hypothetical protein A0H81_13967 [Grifola frondosa]|uniref:Uncharacterized protein n=1 Tax=Grifola frondosa TaxID=5627 RepID=A0A1C7LN78_GRIFR|nr:hypothetical protein A0H81_13967 [Grifola frondosa]